MYMVTVDAEKCDGCEECVGICPNECFAMADEKSSVTGAECEYCESCLGVCPSEAITINEM
jgi:Fe-S-cluster-containing hydrogenase component 2